MEKLLAWPKKLGDVILVAIVFALVWRCLGWTMSQGHFFRADDWDHLFIAHFRGFSDFFSILPHQIYNDRPIGRAFIKALYLVFGLDQVAFHGAYLAVHLLNVVLVYLIGLRISGQRAYAFAAALIFGNTYVALGAVVWVAAAFDLLVSTFVLLSFYLYLRQGKVALVLSLAAYYLAIRSKELGLLLPCFLVLYEVLLVRPGFSRAGLLTILKKTRWHLAVFAVFLVCYAYLAVQSTVFSSAAITDSYHQSISPSEFLAGMQYYLRELFLVYWGWGAESVAVNGLLVLFVVAILYGLLARNYTVAFGGLCFVIALLPVLFLKNHRQSLYLYNPLFFMALMLAGLLEAMHRGLARLTGLHRRYSEVAVAGLLCAVVLTAVTSQHRQNGISFTLRQTSIYWNNFRFMKENFPKPMPETVFFISGLPDYLNVFDYGRGKCLALLYGDPTLKCDIYRPEAELIERYKEYPGSKSFLRYEDGDLRVVRDIE